MLRAPDLVGCALDDRYELLGLVGQGAFGWVYSGRDRRLGRDVAVKLIKPWWAEEDEWVERFEREARMLARINDPGIVQIFDIGRAVQGPYLVAELVHGESLEQRLRRGALAPADAQDVAEGLARALASAHRRGVVHCDVKPANVLIATGGGVKVGDFGVARLAEGSSQALTATIAGTPKYMSPEQARGRPPSPATDVYSAGVVLYEMLAGKAPFRGGSAVELALRHLQDEPPQLPATAPQALAEVVHKALAKDAAERYRDGAALLAALGACATAPVSPGAAPAAADTRWAPEPAASPARDLSCAPTLAAPTRSARAAANNGGGGAPPGRPRAPLGRRMGLLAGVLLLAAAALAAFLLAGAGATTTVPELRGLPAGGVNARAHRTHVHPAFSRRYAEAPAGIAVAQAPGPGRRVSYGATVQVVLSAGPPPVQVPDVVGLQAGAAKSMLAGAGLRYAVTFVAEPRSTANAVLRERPASHAMVPRGSSVALDVAEPPRWRSLTTFSGVDSGRSVPVGIRGSRWRVSYGMSYKGTCLLLFTCLGPSARARNLNTDSTFGGFDLAEGDSSTHAFNSGPGLYRVEVSGGTDSAEWTMTVQDYY